MMNVPLFIPLWIVIANSAPLNHFKLIESAQIFLHSKSEAALGAFLVSSALSN